MEILKAKCPQCGAFYYGWALEDPLKRKCIKCDSQMEITENVEAACKLSARRVMALRIIASFFMSFVEGRYVSVPDPGIK